MRAVMLRLHDEGDRNLVEFLRRVGYPPTQAETLARNLWLLPLPYCESWLDAVRARLAQTRGIAAEIREVDCVSPWRPLS
jgi:hypothetical protein